MCIVVCANNIYVYVSLVTMRVILLFIYTLEVPMSADKQIMDSLRKTMFSRYKKVFHNSLDVVAVKQGNKDVQTMPFSDYLNLLNHSVVE